MMFPAASSWIVSHPSPALFSTHIHAVSGTQVMFNASQAICSDRSEYTVEIVLPPGLTVQVLAGACCAEAAGAGFEATLLVLVHCSSVNTSLYPRMLLTSAS